MKIRSATWLCASAAALFCVASLATAQTASQPATLTESQVTAKLTEAGYTKVHGVEKEGTHFDADAMKDGKAVHLHVDAMTGAITANPNESEESEAHEKHAKHT
ncbi:PepSY domain-containing protein [Lysobacter sp. KIS68-7]|uniref:PepSY domain-containing protein n=1 Tax=Lysobacter sp. KIS68-7 TaxID=2904252 RepID=UPI001E2C6EB9|nr:PepSY domain-containing protein [Lysobacter sp. KIS68-7]UHQ19354.1 PepSY domain-containing protein [Lysobacter sp. KIS68-7]